MATVTCEIKDRIAYITLNRPDQANAIDDVMEQELDQTMRSIETDLTVKVLVLKGAGGNFSAGRDAGATSGSQPDDVTELIEVQRRKTRRLQYIFNYPRPIVAQVEGQCLGAGCDLALTADLVIASDDAVFGDSAIREGQLVSNPHWLWYLGSKKSREVYFLGKKFNAHEAAQFGLINKVVPKAQLEAEVDRFAKAMAICPGDGMVFLKESIGGIMEIRGVSKAGRVLSDGAVMNQLRKREPGELDYAVVAASEGLSEAQRRRDQPFEKLGL